MSHTLTLDLGTSYLKVCIFDEELQLLAVHREHSPVSSPSTGLREISVEAFCNCLAAGIQEVGRRVGGLATVGKICFASQANTFTVFDTKSQPLIPFISWDDQRAIDLSGDLASLVSRSDYYSHTGVANLNHLFLPAKIRWLQRYRPEVIDKTRRVLTISDYLVWWLTGDHLAEASLAGLTGLADIHSLRWWKEAIDFAGVESEWLPPIVNAGTPIGRLRRDRAALLGMSPQTYCFMGCLDQFAGAVGAGVRVPGEVSETTGTVLATVRLADEFTPQAPRGVYQGPAARPGQYYQMVFSSISAGLLERYRAEFRNDLTFEKLDELAMTVPDGADGLVLHPDADELPTAEMFLSRKDSHGCGHEVKAIMEGVAEELRQHVETLCGSDWPTQVKSMGGAARSHHWLQIKSRFLGCPVEPVTCEEPTSLGAARLPVQAE